MAFSIIIPSRNFLNLMKCVQAIRSCGETARVIVVDDDLDFNDWQCLGLLHEEFQRLRMHPVEGAKPFCFARNINIGIDAAGTDDVVILNDDALLVAGHGFTKMSQSAEEHQDVGVWSSSVIGPAVNPIHIGSPSYDSLDSFRTAKRMVPFVCVYIRRAVIDRVGYLEERFCGRAVYGGEDDDYCYRVRQLGMKIAVHHNCLVEHGSLPSTFRPDGKGRSIEGARQKFQEIHGFPMGSR